MGNALKMILLAVGVDVVAVIVSIANFVANTGSSSLRDFNQKISQVLGEREGPEFVSYSGQYVDGATVRSTIEEYAGEYLVRVKTKANPLSFAVYSQPVGHSFITLFPTSSKDGEISDYTSPGSFYYIDANAEFMTATMTNSYGDVVGVCFTEKGAGSNLTSVKSSRYWVEAGAGVDEDDVSKELEDAKSNYMYELRNQSALWSSEGYTNTIKSAKSDLDDAVELLQGTIDSLNASNVSNLETSTVQEYNQALATMQEAEEKAENAWKDLITAHDNSVTEDRKAIGHFDITENRDNVDGFDTANLQYWIREISGGD